jgi:hypothetical protein
MNKRNINSMAKRVARKVLAQDDEALKNVDVAVDNVIASLIAIEENLPDVQANTVEQKAAKDRVKELMNGAIKPYFADIVKALQAFEG